MELNDTTEIVSVSIINMDDGTETQLFEISGSHCHFRKEFEYKNYIIQLRIDWKDIVNGDPVLDADIWRKPKNEKNRLKNGPWHHSEKKFDSGTGRNVYAFEFEGLKLCFGTKTTAAKNIRCDVRIVRPPQRDEER